MTEAAYQFETGTIDQVAFDSLAAEQVLQGRQASRDLPGKWAVIKFPDELMADYRWFEYRKPGGEYAGSIRYYDRLGGWLAYGSQQGLLNRLTADDEPQPIPYGSIGEAASRIENGKEDTEHAARPKLRLIKQALMFAAILRGHY